MAISLDDPATLEALEQLRFQNYVAFLKIDDRRTNELVPLVLNPVQLKLWKRVEAKLVAGIPVRIIILKSRRMGISTLIQAIFAHRAFTTFRFTAKTGAHEHFEADSGAGLEAQREALCAAASQRGWELVDVVADQGESGGKRHENRPGLCAAIERIEAGEADALAVAKLDRLSRSVRDLADLAERSKPKGKRKGWGLILLDIDVDTSSPNGELMLNMMGSVAQWERRIISQRTKDALAVKRAQGCGSDGRAHSAPSSSSGSCARAKVVRR